jgi:hypothetical protein
MRGRHPPCLAGNQPLFTSARVFVCVRACVYACAFAMVTTALCRVLRLILLWDRMTLMLRHLGNVIPMALRYACVYLGITYTFVCVGVQLFGKVPPCLDALNGCYDDDLDPTDDVYFQEVCCCGGGGGVRDAGVGHKSAVVCGGGERGEASGPASPAGGVS